VSGPDKSAAEVLRLAELARAQLRVDPRESLRLAESAVALAGQLRDEALAARALRAKANALWFLNQNQAALDLYHQAATIFEKCGDDIELGRTLSSSIQPLIRLGRYEIALQGAERARSIFSKVADGLRLARLDLNVANILHRQDRFAEALEVCERTYRDLLPYKDTEGIAVALHNMAVCLIALNDFPKALSTYERAREFYVAHGMPALAAQADYNIAYLYYLRGHYSQALEMLRAAREAAGASGDAYHRTLCFMDQSEIYLELNMNEQAVDAAQMAVDGFQELGTGYEGARSVANLAIAEGRMGRTARALDLFARAREMFVREANTVWPSLLDLYQAVVLYEASRYAEAEALCERAREFFSSSELVGKAVLSELLAGRLRLQAGDLQAARAHCEAALQRVAPAVLLPPSQIEDEPYSTPPSGGKTAGVTELPHLAWQAQLLMGQIEESAGALEKAEHHYETAREAAESMRAILRGEELKIAFMKGKLEIYESLARLCLDRVPWRLEKAFTHMEQAKSRSLQDLLVGGPRAIESMALRALREDLNWYYHRIELEESGQEMPSGERVARLRTQASAAEKKLMDLVRELPAAETAIASAGALRIGDIRAALDPDTYFVEYFRVRDRIVAAVVSRNSLEVAPLTHVSRVNDLTRLLLFQISKFRLGAGYVEACQDLLLEAARAHLRELYDELFRPLESFIDDGRLVFVPHESLHHVPLHALFDGEHYLIDRFTIAYAPSASVYAMCVVSGVGQASAGETDMPGDPSPLAADSPAISLVLGVPDSRAPHIPDEARAVAAALPNSELYIGKAASRQVLAERGPSARLLHIASHGRFREDNPLFSSIRLGDGYLTLYDLRQMRLPVELATVSGCGTAMSVVTGGDELLGLVRGLLHAGARSLLLSLWDLHDRSTAQFMRSFYARYPAQPDKAEAVRAAMLEARSRNPHPYYWAPFILIGP
jgi:CHAT domain-containing protein